MSEELVLQAASVIDGTGKPAFRASVGITGARISAVDPTLTLRGARALNAEGLVLAPGFIDSHTHTDGTAFASPLSESKLFQGVTSEVTGNCGIGFFPLAPQRRQLLLGYLNVHDFAMPPEIPWQDFAGYAKELAGQPLGVNHVPLVAHGAIRIAAMGADDRAASPADQQEMNGLLAACMQQGAWGISTGLIYPPGSFADTKELTELARVSAEYDGVYSSHIRGESATLMDAIDEAIAIGRGSRARVVVSHLKPLGKANWGKGETLLKMLDDARAQGVDVTADQYPYEASSTSLTALVPSRFHAGGVEALLACLSAPEKRADLLAGIERELGVRGGAEKVMIASVATARNAGLSGKTVGKIADLWSVPPAAAVVRLLLEEGAAVGAVYFSISEQDVDTIIQSTKVGVGSDGRGLQAGSGDAATHPRSYGTFPRVLRKYVREKKLLSLEAAIYKMTGLTAQRYGLRDRGIIAPGMAADLVLFDPEAIRDIADFANPHRYAEGVAYLWVNGVETISQGKLSGNCAGKVLAKSRG